MIVFDASTLIILAKVSLLREVLVAHKAMIPPIIQEECTRESTREDAQLIAQLIKEELLVIVEPERTNRISQIAEDFSLHRGETAALHLAWQEKAPLATDDTPTRKACKILNIRSIIAVAFLERLVQRDLLSGERALSLVKKFKQYGRYDAETLEAVKAKIKQRRR